MQLADFHFDLPNELIAQFPLPERSASRLLCIDSQTQVLTHLQFTQLIDLLKPGDLLIFNNTKVIPARLRGNKISGGKVELLLERILAYDRALVQIRASKAPGVGDVLMLADNTIPFRVLAKTQKFYEVATQTPQDSMLAVFESVGEIPLPPYMHRKPIDMDKERYQTVYAKYDGSVAAPTAGLHFDQKLLDALQNKGIEFGFITLHIGAGTFSPVRVEQIQQHRMHAEYCIVSADLCARIRRAKAQKHRVVAVGTTSLRAIESAVKDGEVQAMAGETSIFIYPGYQFACVDVLISNLHLPGSTLLMLVSAFAGHQLILKAYQEAIAKAYRFFSYGDAMWMTCAHL